MGKEGNESTVLRVYRAHLTGIRQALQGGQELMLPVLAVSLFPLISADLASKIVGRFTVAFTPDKRDGTGALAAAIETLSDDAWLTSLTQGAKTEEERSQMEVMIGTCTILCAAAGLGMVHGLQSRDEAMSQAQSLLDLVEEKISEKERQGVDPVQWIVSLMEMLDRAIAAGKRGPNRAQQVGGCGKLLTAKDTGNDGIAAMIEGRRVAAMIQAKTGVHAIPFLVGNGVVAIADGAKCAACEQRGDCEAWKKISATAAVSFDQDGNVVPLERSGLEGGSGGKKEAQ